MSLVAEIVMIVAAALASAIVLGRFPRAAAPPPRRERAPPPAKPQQLVANEALVSTTAANALQAHAYLRPALAEIAAGRLAARGMSLVAMSPEALTDLLGEPLAELVRPGRPFPADRHGPGVSHADLDAMLGILEDL